MTDKKTPEIVFAPGCFDNFDGTQEELDQLMKTIQEMFDSGEAELNAIPLEDMLEEFSDEELEQIAEQLGIDPDEYMIDEDDVEELASDFVSHNTRTLH
jgi:diphthamide synthase (EF-2-diphthine--ammonia ligase)